MQSKKRFRPLTRRADFLHLKTHGQSFHVSSWLLVNVQKTQLDQVRCGWTIPRQIGHAVVRNRFRRWGREYLREWCSQLDGASRIPDAESARGLDVNLIFKRKDKDFYKSMSHETFNESLDKLSGKLRRFLE